jgi:membrane fusion protein (multidrug efflux system)
MTLRKLPRELPHGNDRERERYNKGFGMRTSVVNFWNFLFRPAHAVAALALLLTLAACDQATPAGQTAAVAPEVVVGVAAKRALPLSLSYTAQTVGSREVEVRARVSGILLKRLYQEGSTVQQGEVLFELDAAPFEAIVAQDRAALAVMQANLLQARRNRDRVLPLVEKGLASGKERDDSLSGVEVADAQLQAATANLRTAELNLSYTKVRAPIAGLTSREIRSEGSLITTDNDSSLLTRIVQLQPLYVEFAAPEQEAALVRAAVAQRKGHPLSVRVVADADAAPDTTLTGELSFIDNAIDTSSGTVRMRAVLANRDRGIWPGQYVRAEFADLNLADAITVPRRAVLSSAQGYAVWVLDTNNSVQSRSVKLGRTIGDDVLIVAGLNTDERYVLDGLFKVQPGLTVKPVAATPVTVAESTARQTTTGIR